MRTQILTTYVAAFSSELSTPTSLYQNMPFNYTTVSRRAFAIKAGAFMGFGFAIPFVAIWWGW
jgi:hypothetical protein